MNWYYVVGTERKGPISDADLDSLFRNGMIDDHTLVWAAGQDNWKTYRNARPLTSQELSGPGIVTCVISGRKVREDHAVQIDGVWISADFKDEALQRIREGISLGSSVRYGGFWIRAVAVLVDVVIINVVTTPIAMIIFTVIGINEDMPDALKILLFALNGLIGWVLAAAYEIILVAKNGATFGKMACGLRVTDDEGKAIGYGQSTGRFFGRYLSSLTLCIGYVMAAFDEEKRALHDRICETRVIHK